jgi:hypothetical protein
MAYEREPSRGDWPAVSTAGDSGSRILRGSERFRTSAPGARAAGVTSRVRRSVGGSSGEHAVPTAVVPMQTICRNCQQTFIVAMREDTGAVPCIHCGHLNTVRIARPST